MTLSRFSAVLYLVSLTFGILFGIFDMFSIKEGGSALLMYAIINIVQGYGVYAVGKEMI